MRKHRRLIAIAFASVVIALAIVTAFPRQKGPQATEVSYSEFIKSASAGDVVDLSVSGKRMEWAKKSSPDQKMMTTGEAPYELVSRMSESGTHVSYKNESSGVLLYVVLNMLPLFIIIGLSLLLFAHLAKRGPFAKHVKLAAETGNKTHFSDVAGYPEAKSDLSEVVRFLRDPHQFSRLGGKAPRGTLLVGPPGTGKTMLARAVAGEADVPFYVTSGPEFVEMFAGLGAKRIRDMFREARKNAPCIIFIDEIDAVGKSRSAASISGNDEREQTLNQLLVEMDGFGSEEGVFVIGATNRREILDKALLRPGRFDRHVYVGNPDVKDREAILRKVADGINASSGGGDVFASDVSFENIARATPGMSGADLSNLVNEAAIRAGSSGSESISQRDLDAAKDKIMMGNERSSLVLTPKQKERTAWHESGHALIGMLLPDCDEVHKATIVPRGQSLGMVVSLPDYDRLTMTRAEALSRIAMMMGGMAAERVIYGEDGVSNGAASDISSATALANAMVMRWGMSDVIGQVDFSVTADAYAGAGASPVMSSDGRNRAENEVRRIISDALSRSDRMLRQNGDKLEKIKNALLDKETLSSEELHEASGLTRKMEKKDE